MNQFDFKRFWRKYGNFVLAGLFFLFIINNCQQQARYSEREKTVEQQTEAPSQMEKDSSKLKTFEELMRQRQPNQPEGPGSFFIMLLLLGLGVGIVWVTRQPWMIALWQNWFPGKVHLKVFKSKDKITGKNLVKVSIENNTRDGLTFLPPQLVFKSWGNERRFRLKGSNQEDMFPLTLTPGTGHRLVLDLDQFYEKIPDLRKANRVGAMVETTDGKIYKKFLLPGWVNLLFK
ncbi:hypothetical protein DDZ16_05715 [Marinilabilia rubra]|uniref:Uncharacterized protein n=2 Tax=Marinilabilia rubra TaxID=2162893 RepID=A0A2U2BBW8_9BACT|nr:hypothetical protein DDZ16_05715 [Marinilabilia rubra]